MAAGIDKQSNKVRVAALLSVIGEDAVDLFGTFEWTAEADKEKLEKVLEKFQGYCQPRSNVLFETYLFGNRKQGESESIDAYVTALRKMSDTCEFQDRDRRIRDQVVLGLRDSSVRERILRRPNPSLVEVLEFARASEVAEQQSKLIIDKSTIEEACAVKTHKKRAEAKQKRPVAHQNKKSPSQCKFCGKKHEFVKEKCPAFGKKCNTCGGQNHFATCCSKEKTVRAVSEQVEQINLFNVNTPKCKKKTQSVLVVKSKKIIQFHIDTGASCDVLSWKDYVRVTSDHKGADLIPNQIELIAYGGNKWKSVGTCEMEVELKGKRHILSIVVVNINAQPLLSLESSEKLGIVKVLSCDQESVKACEVENNFSRNKIMEQFGDVFQGLGKLDGVYHITVDKEVKPVIHPPRRVPVALRDQLKTTLEDLEAKDVLAKVTEPTQWVSSMLIVNKPGKMRICLDPKNLNQAIQREHYPLPTIEDVATRLKSAKVFSVLDAKSGFWQIELDHESSLLTTFNTPFGRYRWKRMPFGVNSAPEIWQRRMHEFVEDLRGVEVIADDFLVCGHGESEKEALRDHDKNLVCLLEKARTKNLKLNPDKFKLRMSEVTFIGHVLTKDGVKMDPRKVEAIEKLPSPTCPKDLMRILGMIQYLSKFLPRLSELTEPLRKLTHKDQEWEWRKEHQLLLAQLKRMLTETPVLRYFDCTKPVTIQCDASEKGLGAVLLQEGQPVAFSSRSLTATEQRYAQIEKEMLAIVHACTKFYQYVYGLPAVYVESDHKPLETIFKKEIGKSPRRLQRMLLSVQNFNLTVRYKRGAELYIADTLSRAYLETVAPEEFNDVLSVQETTLVREFETVSAVSEIANGTDRMLQIRKATEEDSVLCLVKYYIENGWPEVRNEVNRIALPYFPFRDELVIDEGFVCKLDRIVIPGALRKSVIETIHSTHIGIENCLRRAREYVYWPNMNAEIRDYISKCDICCKFRAEQQREPMQSYDVPERAWSTVSSDLFDFNGRTYIVLVDHYSSFFECESVQPTTTSVVKFLKTQFARYGIPDKMISDNGPQFSSLEFKRFVETWQFEHVTSSPRYPQANGKAESAVKTCKNLMKKALDGKVDLQLALLDWRNTPVNGMNSSPAQRMLNKRTKAMLPVKESLLQPEVQRGVKEKIQKSREEQKTRYDVKSKDLKILKQGDVIRMKLPGETTWTKGVCMKAIGKRSYRVKVRGSIYRRNRRQLLATNENPPTDAESSSRDLSDENPVNGESPRRIQRVRRPPIWLNDYVR